MLLTSSGQEWQFHIATMTSSGQQWQFQWQFQQWQFDIAYDI